jgi:hypothetical protein
MNVRRERHVGRGDRVDARPRFEKAHNRVLSVDSHGRAVGSTAAVRCSRKRIDALACKTLGAPSNRRRNSHQWMLELGHCPSGKFSGKFDGVDVERAQDVDRGAGLKPGGAQGHRGERCGGDPSTSLAAEIASNTTVDIDKPLPHAASSRSETRSEFILADGGGAGSVRRRPGRSPTRRRRCPGPGCRAVLWRCRRAERG